MSNPIDRYGETHILGANIGRLALFEALKNMFKLSPEGKELLNIPTSLVSRDTLDADPNARGFSGTYYGYAPAREHLEVGNSYPNMGRISVDRNEDNLMNILVHEAIHGYQDKHPLWESGNETTLNKFISPYIKSYYDEGGWKAEAMAYSSENNSSLVQSLLKSIGVIR